MQQNKNFVVTVTLGSPIIITSESYLTLDSVLSAAAGGQPLPLEQTCGIFHASAAILVGAPLLNEATFVARVTPRDLSGSHVLPNKKGRKGMKLSVSTVAYPDKTTMDRYPAWHVPKLIWFARGCPERTMELLSGLHGLGKKYNSGFGAITGIEASPSDSDYAMTLPDGTPGRPIPLTLVEHFGMNAASDFKVDKTTYRPDYFDYANARLCVVPTTRIIPEAATF